MTFAMAVHILFTSFVYPTNVYLSVIHGIKRKPHSSVVWNWYHFVAIANLHQPPADINTRLQLSDTSSIPPMHGGFLLTSRLCVTGLCEGNSDETGEFPTQRASSAENFPFDDVIVFAPYVAQIKPMTGSSIAIVVSYVAQIQPVRGRCVVHHFQVKGWNSRSRELFKLKMLSIGG